MQIGIVGLPNSTKTTLYPDVFFGSLSQLTVHFIKFDQSSLQ